MNLTDEEIKEFWERCGLRWFWNHNPDCECGEEDDDDDMRDWHYRVNGEWRRASNFYHEKMNDITRPEFIGYLFKYAAPKAEEAGYTVRLQSDNEHQDKLMYYAVCYKPGEGSKGLVCSDPATHTSPKTL